MTGRRNPRAALVRCLAALAVVAASTLGATASAPAAVEPTTLVPDRCEGTDAPVAPVAIPTALLASGDMVPLTDRMRDVTFRTDLPDNAMSTPLCAVRLDAGVLTYHWLYCDNFNENSCANGALRRVTGEPIALEARVAYALSLVDNRTHVTRTDSQRLVWCATEGRPAGAVPRTYIEGTDDPDLRCPDWSKAVAPAVELTGPATALADGATGRITLTSNRRTVTVTGDGVQLSVCSDGAATATLVGDRLTFTSALPATVVLCATRATAGTGAVTAALPGGVLTWRRPSGTCQGLMELSPGGGPRRTVSLVWPGNGTNLPTTTTTTTGPPATVRLRAGVTAPAFPLEGVGTVTVDVVNDGPDPAHGVTVTVRAPALTAAGGPRRTAGLDASATIDRIAVGGRATVAFDVTAAESGTFTGAVELGVGAGVTNLGVTAVPFSVATYAISGSVETRAPDPSSSTSRPTRSPRGPTTTRPRPPNTPSTTAGPDVERPTTTTTTGRPPADPTTAAPTTAGASTSAGPSTGPATTGDGATSSSDAPAPFDPTDLDYGRAVRDPTPILEDDTPVARDGAFHVTYTVQLVNRSRDRTTRPRAVLVLPARVALDGALPPGCTANDATASKITCTPDDAQHAALDNGTPVAWRVLVRATTRRGVVATLTAYDGTAVGKSDTEPTMFSDTDDERLMPPPTATGEGRGAHVLAVVLALVAALMIGGVWLQGRRSPTRPSAVAPTGAFDAG